MTLILSNAPIATAKAKAKSEDQIVLRAATPKLDLSRADGTLEGRIESRLETRFETRIDQIQFARAKDKLPLKLTVRTRRDLRLTMPLALASAKARVDQAPEAMAKVRAKIEAQKVAQTEAQNEIRAARYAFLVAASEAPDHEISASTYRAAIQRLNFQNPHDLWAGHLKVIEETRFKEDPSLKQHVAIGETARAVFRFERGRDGEQTLHPTMLFLAGRDQNYDDSLMQRQRSDDPDSSSQGPNFFEAVAQTLGRMFGLSTSQSGATHHFRYTYVNLGTVNAADKIGHYFVENIIHKSTTIIGANSLEQDCVLELSTNDSDATLSFREVTVRLTKLSPDSAFVKVARVNYAADRTIVSRQMFEGKVSTKNWQKISDEICNLTGKPWDVTAAENDL